MSWNIESFGEKGMLGGNPPDAVKFVAAVVHHVQADLVGIMEVKGGFGKRLTAQLVAELNNVTTPKTWNGRWSTRQDGGDLEEYILLWRSDGSVTTSDANSEPGPTSLMGVVDTNAMASLLRGSGWSMLEKTAFYVALGEKLYARRPTFKFKGSPKGTTWWRVIPQFWDQLSTGTVNTVDLSGTGFTKVLTAAELQEIARKLLAVDILAFPTQGERSPYLGNFLLGPNQRPLRVVLFHAQGPTDPTRFDSINIIALSNALRAGGTAAVLMGDFNIKVAEATKLGRVYERTPTGFGPKKPVQRVPVFQPITDPAPGGLGMTNQFSAPTDVTSLRKGWLPNGAAVSDALANTYDKAFTRDTANVTAGNPQIINLIEMIASNQVAFQQNVARAALTFFRSYRGNQYLVDRKPSITKDKAAVDKIVASYDTKIGANMVKINAYPGGYPQLQIDHPNSPLITRDHDLKAERQPYVDDSNWYQDVLNNLAWYTTFVNDPTNLEPTGIGSAFATYRYAISDHLPITIDLTVT